MSSGRVDASAAAPSRLRRGSVAPSPTRDETGAKLDERPVILALPIRFAAFLASTACLTESPAVLPSTVSEGQSPTDDRPLADRRALVDSRTRVHRGYTVRLALDDDETGYDLTVREGETLRASVPGLDPAYLDASVEELLAEFPVDAPPRARAGDD